MKTPIKRSNRPRSAGDILTGFCRPGGLFDPERHGQHAKRVCNELSKKTYKQNII